MKRAASFCTGLLLFLVLAGCERDYGATATAEEQFVQEAAETVVAKMEVDALTDFMSDNVLILETCNSMPFEDIDHTDTFRRVHGLVRNLNLNMISDQFSQQHQYNLYEIWNQREGLVSSRRISLNVMIGYCNDIFDFTRDSRAMLERIAEQYR